MSLAVPARRRAIDKAWALYESDYMPQASRESGAVMQIPDDYESWLRQQFPSYFTATHGEPLSFAPYHHELWQWVWQMRPGVSPAPFVAIWPRGAGKSTSVELACIVMALFRLRRYALYVSATQEQADDHVGNNIATLCEEAHMDRLVSKYGHSRGWRRNRVRTLTGFTVDALGLDVAGRGVKLEDARPDVLILDDLDQENDTEHTILKKIRSLTRKLLPAGSQDLAVIGIQNLIHDQGIFARLVDGRADFLSTRVISGPYPALEGLAYEGSGKTATLTHGKALWSGLSLEICQQKVNLMGLEAFLAECQHEQHALQGTMFGDVWMPGVHVIEPFDIPAQWGVRRSFDWGSSKPFSVGWWAHSDGATPAPDGRVYPKNTAFRIMELYGWNGKPNEGLRLTNTDIARRIKAKEEASPYQGRVRPGPADSAIFDVVDGTSVADDMATQGIRWTPAQKGPGSRRQGWQLMRRLLKSSSQWPMEESGLFIFSTCPQFIRTVTIAPRDIMDQDDIVDSCEDHALDESRYHLSMPFSWTMGRVSVKGY